MSNSQYFIGGVSNWDSRFRILDGSGLEPTIGSTNFNQSGAEAFSTRYYASNMTVDSYNAVHGGTIGYQVNGVDIGSLFREKNFVELSLPSTSIDGGLPTSGGTVTLNIKNDGTWTWTSPNSGTVVDSGRWLASGGTPGNYEVIYTFGSGFTPSTNMSNGVAVNLGTSRNISVTGYPHTTNFGIKIQKALDNYMQVNSSGFSILTYDNGQ